MRIVSKSFFGMILFLTKFDTHFVYTYLYYKRNLLRRGAGSGFDFAAALGSVSEWRK